MNEEVVKVEEKGIQFAGDGKLRMQLLDKLPYDLTPDQTEVLSHINADMTSAKPMNRLLEGDVGSGKTLVAVLAILHAVESGYQCALMVPTEILAEQPMPEVMTISFFFSPSSSTARSNEFRMVPWPQPGHHMCGKNLCRK